MTTTDIPKLITAAPSLLYQCEANAEAMTEWLDWELPPSLREAIQGRLICTQAAIDKVK